MNRKKLGTCVAAAIISVGGSTLMAAPAQATLSDSACSSYEQGYADGYSEAKCKAEGHDHGTGTDCVHHADGTFSFTKACREDPY